MAGAIAPHILTAKPVASTCTVRYLNPAKSDLLARAKCSEDSEQLCNQLEVEGRTVFDVSVEVEDETGIRVAEIIVTWHVSLGKRPS